VGVRNLSRSRYGRGMVAARDNPLAATASGVSLLRIKLFAFAVSAALAGLAGAFYAVQKTVITPEDFTADFSIFFLLIIVVGGLGRLWGPVVGTLVFFLLPELLGPLQSWRLLIYGVVLLVLMVFAPHGIMGMPVWQRRRRHALPDAPPVDAPVQAQPAQRLSLTVRDVHKQFGGVAALQGCALTAEAGSTHALVGPNGSGKTTTLNVISGFIRSDKGAVLIGDTDVSGRAPHRIAQLGVGAHLSDTQAAARPERARQRAHGRLRERAGQRLRDLAWPAARAAGPARRLGRRDDAAALRGPGRARR
jgi:branched-chain amino acid transport system permease protein